MPEVTALVHVANHLAHMVSGGCMQGETFSPLVPECYQVLSLGVGEEVLLQEMAGLLKEAEPFFSLIEAN